MIHYHGGPITPASAAAVIYAGRHAMVSYADRRDLPLVAEVCQSFALDNGAFSFWKAGKPTDWDGYYAWVNKWMRHPGFDWALIPDVIDGDEAANDDLIAAWPIDDQNGIGVPVWHLHESLGRLVGLAESWPRIAFGSSGQWAAVGTKAWWERMNEAISRVCDDTGRPLAKLHGLRMLNPAIFTRLPFASADSTNVARNIGMDVAWKGTYLPPSAAVRGIVLAERIEAQQSCPIWTGLTEQQQFELA